MMPIGLVAAVLGVATNEVKAGTEEYTVSHWSFRQGAASFSRRNLSLHFEIPSSVCKHARVYIFINLACSLYIFSHTHSVKYQPIFHTLYFTLHRTRVLNSVLTSVR